MLSGELLPRAAQGVPGGRPLTHGNGQGGVLAHVLDVGVDAQLLLPIFVPLALESGACLIPQGRYLAVGLLKVHFIHPPEKGSNQVVLDVGEEEPKGAE